MGTVIEDALNLQSASKQRSMGIKLIVICVLALLMNIPGFFVQGLLDDRIHNNSPVIQHPDGSSTFATVDYYQSVGRSLKYILLFEGLVFLTYFTFEVTGRKRMHAAQYVLVGVAQVIFYLLLLSLAEKIGFDYAFLIAGGATVMLLSTNAGWIFASRIQGLRAFAIFSPLYGLIYVLLRLKDYALLVGSVASFAAVAAVMYFTRRIDWYSSLPVPDGSTDTGMSPVPKSAS
ncbi:inner membrane CreD family protein [Terracidiphilus gabretensis]|uniref:inner membrane CreD family protein n=1 Tax=Terracidiphilus gabretensis TaxID=1577687 RepID=UPI0009EAB715|nr:inner membrane CreD family protein [Terracidiphilus gabretensis]